MHVVAARLIFVRPVYYVVDATIAFVLGISKCELLGVFFGFLPS